MRNISYTQFLTFEFQGNVNNAALCIGDADNDGDYELVIGNVQGTLALFKNDGSKPYKIVSNLGTV